MHETALAANVVEILCQEARSHRLERVERVRLRVGALRGVVPELLKTAVGFSCRGTPAEGAEICLETAPGRARCAQCNTEFPIEELFFVCPSCQLPGGEVLAGQELDVLELEGR